ncbi:MAG: LytTR family transcriptional regulator, partial [Cyclobacteriaceae bacterium]
LIVPSGISFSIHISFIVKLNEINTISPKEITVLNEKVPVGRTYYQNLLNGIQKLGSNGVD